ncbi:Clp protease N-terminal domain-containing protein [Micrococcus sp.]|uniref:Clp protease N-terminal domain-containing protein n=1 Tax=Micrococcus sp. TaxID=1271 RepID=UPI0026DB7B25|nr:Clp protease N-terminal domain-containing protein [Micrococcus sp.]MDO4239378.1 Clp protease N-terminal domain-containing protein [Micrococcus sp.]
MAQDPADWRRTAVLLSGAWREALRVSAPRVDPEHLFLGVLSSGGPAARIASRHGLSLEAARRGAAVRAGRQLRAVGTDVAREGRVPRAPLAALDKGGASTLPLSSASEGMLPGRGHPLAETAWALELLQEPAGVVSALVAAADVDVDALRRSLRAAGDAPDMRLPGAELAVTPAGCLTPVAALTPPDGIRTSGAMAGRAGRLTSLGAEWFVSAPQEHVTRLLRDPEQIRAVTAQPAEAEVDDAFGVVTSVRERAGRGGSHRSIRQLFPSEAAGPDGTHRIRWVEVLDEHRSGPLAEDGTRRPDSRDYSGALAGAYVFVLTPDSGPGPERPVDYPGHEVLSGEGTRVRLVRVRRTVRRRDALADRATRWPQAWAVAQHLQSLASLAAERG